MDVVRTGELDAPPQGIEKAAALDERRGNRETEQREPRDCDEVDPREVAEEPRQADRQERDGAGSQRDGHVTAAADGPHQRDRTAVRRGKDDRPDQDVEEHSCGSAQLAIRNAEDRRTDAKSE